MASMMVAYAQDLSRPSLSLDVKPIATGGAVQSSNSAQLGRTYDYQNGRTLESASYASSRSHNSQTGLEIAVRNFRATPQAAVIETRYFAKPVSGGEPFVLNTTSQPVEIGAADTVRVTSQSAPARSVSAKTFQQSTNPNPNSTRQTVAAATTSAAGTKLFGWIVQVLVDGRPIQMRASNPTLEQLAKKEQTPQGTLPSAGFAR